MGFPLSVSWCFGASVRVIALEGSGYYGCFAASRRACDNSVLVPRRLAEDIILRSVCKRLLDPKPLLHVLQRVEEEVQRLYPETFGLVHEQPPHSDVHARSRRSSTSRSRRGCRRCVTAAFASARSRSTSPSTTIWSTRRCVGSGLGDSGWCSRPQRVAVIVDRAPAVDLSVPGRRWSLGRVWPRRPSSAR